MIVKGVIDIETVPHICRTQQMWAPRTYTSSRFDISSHDWSSKPVKPFPRHKSNLKYSKHTKYKVLQNVTPCPLTLLS
jgi:hypothetical protein